MRILVVEDDRKVAMFHPERIAAGRARGRCPATTEAARANRHALVGYDAVVLDVMLPGRSGFQVLRDIRARKADAPGADPDREGLDRRARRRARQRRGRLHGRSRSRSPSSRRGCARCCGAARRARARCASRDLEMDTVRADRAARPADADRPEAEGIRAARVPDAQQRSPAHASRSSSSTSGTSTSTASATSSRCTSTRCGTRSTVALPGVPHSTRFAAVSALSLRARRDLLLQTRLVATGALVHRDVHCALPHQVRASSLGLLARQARIRMPPPTRGPPPVFTDTMRFDRGTPALAFDENRRRSGGIHSRAATSLLPDLTMRDNGRLLVASGTGTPRPALHAR